MRAVVIIARIIHPCVNFHSWRALRLALPLKLPKPVHICVSIAWPFGVGQEWHAANVLWNMTITCVQPLISFILNRHSSM